MKICQKLWEMLSTLLSLDGHSLGHIRDDQSPWAFPYCGKVVDKEYLKEPEIQPIADTLD